MARQSLIALVVLAEPLQRQAIVTAISGYFRTLEAASLAEATAQLTRQTPNVIIIDPDLPDGDGITWIKQVHQSLHARNIKIACVTHRATVREKIAGFRAGADDYIIYPIHYASFPHRLVLLNQIKRTF